MNEYDGDYNSHLPYPFRFDASRTTGESKLFLGAYSYPDGSTEEQFYPTNLHQREIFKGEYFNVTDWENFEWTFIIDHVVDMNSVEITGD